MRITNEALACVVYIGEATEKGTFNPRGTGFITFVERPPKDEPVFYLVTADHVRRLLINERHFAIRINDSQGKAQVFRSPTGFKWWGHPTDKSVDAAVYPWTAREFPFACFPANRFVTEKEVKFKKHSDPGIGIGDEIYIIGLFRKMRGRDRITPIVRHGHIAMMATEPIKTRNYGEAYFHLVEAFSTAGLSGSPVFVNETVYFRYQGSKPRAYGEGNEVVFPVAMAVGPTHILGLLHGLMPVEAMVEFTGADPRQKWHSGISLVVPSTQILEIINQPKLIAYEEEVERALKDDDGPVEASIMEDLQDDKQERRNRDTEVPPVNRKKFFDDLSSATRKRKPSSRSDP